MQPALIVLSPLEQQLLQPMAAAELALRLKGAGVRRADIASKAHFSAPASHHHLAVCAFTHAAGNMVDMMNHVLGQSTLYDIGLDMERARLPGLPALRHAAELCFSLTGNHAPLPHDVRDMTAVFYALFHRQNYDWMIFPQMTQTARKALLAMEHGLHGNELPHFGRPLLLAPLRTRLTAFYGHAPASAARLN